MFTTENTESTEVELFYSAASVAHGRRGAACCAPTRPAKADVMSPRRTPQGSAIAAAIEAGEWDRLTLALALALARLMETLPPDMAPELLTLLAGDDDLTAHGEPVEPYGEPFDRAQDRPIGPHREAHDA